MGIPSWIRPISAVGLFLVAGVAVAQSDPGILDERFRLNLGGFFQKFTTTVSLGPKDGGEGTDISLEKELGLGNQTTILLDGSWAFGPHGRLVFGYRGWSRNATHTITREIEWGDHTFPINASVDIHNKAHIADLYYGYSFVHSSTVDLGLMLGVIGGYYSVDLQATLAGVGEQHEQKNVLVPLPSLGAYVEVALMPQLTLKVSARGLPKVTVSDYSADQVEVVAGLNYFFTKNVGLGVTYYYDNFNLTRNVAQQAKLGFKYSGPMAYLALAF